MHYLHVARLFHSSFFTRWFSSPPSFTAAAKTTTLFVGGLSFDTNEPILKDAFEPHGDIVEVKVICHHVSGRSKGYGFVNYANETAATTALKEMGGKLLDGRNIRVEYAYGRRKD